MHGGTELLPAMGMGLLAPDIVVSLRDVSDLQVCHFDDGNLVVGGGLTHLQVSVAEQIRTAAPLLAEVAEGVGNIRVRATGTLGGNLAFAEPRSDLTTALLALDAQVRLVSQGGVRTLFLRDFMVGPYEVDLRPGELIWSVVLRENASDFSVYRKIVVSERPVVGVALVHLLHPLGWRLVVGAVGLMPTIVDFEALAEIDATAIAAAVDVTRDISGSEEYKRHLTAVTVERCLSAVSGLDDEKMRHE